MKIKNTVAIEDNNTFTLFYDESQPVNQYA